MKKIIQFLAIALFVFLSNTQSFGQKGETRIEPPFWWVGMENSALELLISDATKPISGWKVTIKNENVVLKKVHKVDNPRYLFLELELKAGIEAGEFPIELTDGKETIVHNYKLLKRKDSPKTRGLSSNDAIYLLYPDRFSNGNPANDSIKGMRQTANRTDRGGRHGGDIEGIIKHLDYVEEMGFSAIWFNPFLENDMESYSYHGYAITDHYKVDARFGGNEMYLKLVEECHKRGIKVIKDMVYNHCGIEHNLYRDLPAVDFFNNDAKFVRTNYRESVIVDPYASKSDLKGSVDAWFDKTMPDFNQKNDRVKAFLIQNSIWWIEHAGLDGFRIDTYFYSDLEFSAELGKRINQEYPNFGMFGETWVKAHTMQAYFTQNNGFRNEVNTSLPGITDFMLSDALKKSYKEKMDFTGGVVDVYYALAQDFLYENPYNNVVFLDNHDIARIYVEMDRNEDKFKSTLAFLFTTRGIPCLYYGTELMMDHEDGEDHGLIRADFPGGWKGDKNNAFTKKGRTEKQNMAYDYVTGLLKYRNKTAALRTGKLMQFIPQDGVYVYFRYDEEKTVMIVMNTHGNRVSVNTERFAERTQGFSSAKAVPSGEKMSDIKNISLKPYETVVLELVK
jgi:glycosidase